MGGLKISPFIYTYSEIDIHAFNWEPIRFNVSAQIRHNSVYELQHYHETLSVDIKISLN